MTTRQEWEEYLQYRRVLGQERQRGAPQKRVLCDSERLEIARSHRLAARDRETDRGGRGRSEQ